MTEIQISPLHILYLVGVFVILTVMILRKDTPAVCIAFLFLLGLVGLKSLSGGIQVVFRAILYAGGQFMEIIATIALVSALSKCLSELGSDRLLMAPMKKIMKTPSLTWWILALTMLLCSLFLWPSPSVALVGAILVPFAVKAGLNPLLAAMAMNLSGHGFALSYDCIIQGAPKISAHAANIPTASVLSEGRIFFWVMGAVSLLAAFFLNQKTLQKQSPKEVALPSPKVLSQEGKNPPHRAATFLALLTPLAFLLDIALLLLLRLNGGEATSLVSGTAVLLTCIGAILQYKKQSLEKITDFITEGFLFAIRIFAPVIVIGAFFFLGGEGIHNILGEGISDGILNDWALWLASHLPLNPYMAIFLQMLVGGLTGLDGSGFSGLPLTGSLAQTFGTAVGLSIPALAALGQMTAIFVGGGTLVPWGLIPVAAICQVSPVELARKNLLPVFLGFVSVFLLACLLLT
ncbi:MAG: citrate transporter [bacterium]|nr:citrate transporter [bacterium]